MENEVMIILQEMLLLGVLTITINIIADGFYEAKDMWLELKNGPH